MTLSKNRLIQSALTFTSILLGLPAWAQTPTAPASVCDEPALNACIENATHRSEILEPEFKELLKTAETLEAMEGPCSDPAWRTQSPRETAACQIDELDRSKAETYRKLREKRALLERTRKVERDLKKTIEFTQDFIRSPIRKEREKAYIHLITTLRKSLSDSEFVDYDRLRTNLLQQIESASSTEEASTLKEEQAALAKLYDACGEGQPARFNQRLRAAQTASEAEKQSLFANFPPDVRMLMQAVAKGPELISGLEGFLAGLEIQLASVLESMKQNEAEIAAELGPIERESKLAGIKGVICQLRVQVRAKLDEHCTPDLRDRIAKARKEANDRELDLHYTRRLIRRGCKKKHCTQSPTFRP